MKNSKTRFTAVTDTKTAASMVKETLSSGKNFYTIGKSKYVSASQIAAEAKKQSKSSKKIHSGWLGRTLHKAVTEKRVKTEAIYDSKSGRTINVYRASR